MKIAFLSAELAPHAHVGGMGDVARSLPDALAAAGEEVVRLVPAYAGRFPSGVYLGDLDLGPMGPVRVTHVEGHGAETWLIESSRWFGDGTVYSDASDEHLRFGALTAGALAAVAEWEPDVVHLNDWHTALGALHLAALGLPRIPTVLTIHNLAFQGLFPARDLEAMGLGDQVGMAVRDGEEVNAMATGIATASVITTVSPTYAAEITTPDGGWGLDALLRTRGSDLVGILNGIGEQWDPAADPHIPEPFGPGDLTGKAAARSVLIEAMGLAAGAEPIAGVVSRLTPQKGLDLVEPALEPLLAQGELRLIVVGTGEESLEREFRGLEQRHPGVVAFAGRFDTPLAHLVEAGVDMFLMPSRFESCGLNQMYSMRYGSVPIVHRTGGLADTVAEWDPDQGSGTGFTFEPCESGPLRQAVERALHAFGDADVWGRIIRNGMSRDDSWASRVPAYLDAYRQAMG